MSSKVKEIVFFMHPKSDKCHVTHQLLKQYQIPYIPCALKRSNVNILKKKGKAGMNVRGVPSLIVTFDDGNLRRFEGEDCNEWIQYLVRESQKDAHQHELDQRNEQVGSRELLTHDSEFVASEDEFSDFSDFSDDEILDEPPAPTNIPTTGTINIDAIKQKAEEDRQQMDIQTKGIRKKKSRI